jgi:hypothetical protein
MSLPGIGVLVLDHNPASIDQSAKIISPPSTTISFKSDKNTGYDGFVDYLSIIEDRDRTYAKNNFDVFIARITKSIDKNGEFLIPNIGTFIADQSGDYIFTESSQKEYSSFQQFESYPLSPIQKFGAIDGFQFTESKKQDVRDPWFYWLPFVILGVIAIASLFYFLKDNQLNTSFENEIILDEKNNLNELQNNDTITTIYNQNEKVGEGSETGEAIQKIEEEPIVNTKTHTVKNCIIITGSYQQSKSSLKMIEKLQSKGYQVYTEQHNNFTRVGISFDCENIDLKEYIYEIRNTISKDAWYLIPSITVH